MRKRSVRGIHPLPSLRQLHHVSAERLVEALMALDRLGYPGRSDCHPGPADRLLNAARKTTTASGGIIGHPGKCDQSESAARPTASTAAASRSDDRPIRTHKEEPHPFTRPGMQIPQPVPAGMFRADAVAVRNPVAYCVVDAPGIKASCSHRYRIVVRHTPSLGEPGKLANPPRHHCAPREYSVVSQAYGCHMPDTRLSHGFVKATQNHLHNRSSCTHKSALVVLLTPNRRGYYAASLVYARCAL